MPEPQAIIVPEAETTGRLTVDLAALAANWRDLADRAAPAECAAVVKADAYGTGIARAVPALARAGCSTFFVATPEEARRVRKADDNAVIYVLGGLWPDSEAAFLETDARPVLGSLQEVAAWGEVCRTAGAPLPAAIHIDTGMNRLGLSAEEVETVANDPSLLHSFELSLVMSHLACIDQPDYPLNAEQLARFEELRRKLPDAPASLANSGGTILGGDYRFDLARPGIALYGGRTLTDRPNPMRPVVTAEARIIRLRRAKAGETVGYGAARTLTRDTTLAIISAGYADGLIRAAGSSDDETGALVHVGETAAPIVGRVSMDLTAIDVTGIPEDRVVPGSYVELFGNRIMLDEFADAAGTIGYEVLTRLGARFHRLYVGGPDVIGR